MSLSDYSALESGTNSNPIQHDFLIVGIGASAGGVQALKEFFENVPADSGIAYVVILHLSPSHDSQLTQVLQSVTTIPVSQVVEKVQVQPNHVYVIPPNQHLMMEDGNLLVLPNTEVEDRRAPVDIFFRTLAESHRSLAVCVVLSGMGANGSMGLKRIKEQGGAVFVQNPREAEFNEMPRNSIATELVDEVLPVAAIPQKIIDYRDSLGTIHISADADKRPEAQQLALREIFSQLRMRTGNDFSNYKRPTLLRRIERRINMRNLPDLTAYAAYLLANPDEANALLKDLLISVTNFFRDKPSWNVMETEVLPKVLKNKTADGALRIWVAGCATGEEAYSIAMLCAERTLSVLDAPKVQIFATDIDETAIAHAREGLYTLNDAADVSPERLRRFFTKEGDSYRVRREIREMIMFAHHNFIKDPPFSHLDIISCRNVLIYLNQIAQERVSETFHFALEPGGYIFLGLSESFDGAVDLYSSYNREHHIFQTRQVQSRLYPIPESVPSFRTGQMIKPTPVAEPENRNQDRITFGDLHQRLLEEYAPPSIVVNEEHNVVHISDKAGRFLHIPGGEPSQSILKLVVPELRLDLRSALLRTIEQQAPVRTRPLQATIAGREENITLYVKPVFQQNDAAHGFILVLFEPVTPGEEPAEIVYTTTNDSGTRYLEEELIRLKAQLRSTTEQYEFQSEELKASNEELQAMNEELRSAAEELETGKEELQSINEEMRTVNQELSVKIDETTLSSNNLQNLINSTDIGTIFLDRSLRVKLFTPAIGRIFNLIPADHGRPLTDITNKLVLSGIEQDAETVLETLQTVEREISSNDNQVFLMRILPYRTAEDRINGVVITFISITDRKLSETRLLELHRRTSEILESINDAFYTIDVEGNFTYVNNKAGELWGRKPDILLGKNYWVEFPQTVDNESYQLHQQAMQTGRTLHYEAFSSVVKQWVDVSIYPDKAGGLSVYFRDISQRKEAEKALQKSEERLRMLVTTSADAIYTMSPDWKEMRDLKGSSFLPDTHIPNQVWMKKYIPDEDWLVVSTTIQKAIDTKSAFELEHRVIRSDGSIGWTYSRAIPLLNEQNELLEWFGTATDITARKHTEQALRESEERLQIAMDSATDYSIITTDVDGIITGWNTGAQRIFGYPAAETIGQPADLVFTPEDRAANVPEQEMQTAREKGRAEDERWHLRKDGSRFFASGVMAPIRDGKLSGYVKVARDMTERREAQETLRISEERYRTVIESTKMGTWDWNITENRTIWNKEHYTQLGANPQHLPMNSEYFLQFIYPEDIERVTNTLMEAVASNGTYQSEFRIIRADNLEVRWMSGFGRVVKVEDGKAVRMVGIMIDITERKAMEQQKDDFIGIASHELKTPVTSIKAYAQILLDMFEQTADTKSIRLMQRLDTQVDRLTSLIGNLLDTTKIAEGQLPLHFESFNVIELIAERIEDLQRLSQTHQLQITHCEDITIQADRERIGQVIANLVSNAIKYSPQGKEILISCHLEGDKITVEVQDKGIGIPEEAQAKVFDRFFRVKDSQLQTFPGMGLGLYITAGIVYRHGGTINVKSVLGQGSVFSFTLPVANS